MQQFSLWTCYWTLNPLHLSHSFVEQRVLVSKQSEPTPLTTLTLCFLIRNALSREEKRFSDLLLALLLIMISLLLCLAELTNNPQPINNTFKRFNLTQYEGRGVTRVNNPKLLLVFIILKLQKYWGRLNQKLTVDFKFKLYLNFQLKF